MICGVDNQLLSEFSVFFFKFTYLSFIISPHYLHFYSEDLFKWFVIRVFVKLADRTFQHFLHSFAVFGVYSKLGDRMPTFRMLYLNLSLSFLQGHNKFILSFDLLLEFFCLIRLLFRLQSLVFGCQFIENACLLLSLLSWFVTFSLGLVKFNFKFHFFWICLLLELVVAVYLVLLFVYLLLKLILLIRYLL